LYYTRKKGLGIRGNSNCIATTGSNHFITHIPSFAMKLKVPSTYSFRSRYKFKHDYKVSVKAEGSQFELAAFNVRNLFSLALAILIPWRCNYILRHLDLKPNKCPHLTRKFIILQSNSPRISS